MESMGETINRLARVTLANESVTFTAEGVYIQPILSDGFFFNGTPDQLITIMIAHPELDIEHARFYVREQFLPKPKFMSFDKFAEEWRK